MKNFKRFFIKFIAITLCLVCCVGCFSSCKNKEGDGVIKSTDIDLIKNGASEYKIVIPKEASSYEEYAAEELTLYLEQSTDCKLETITDDNLSFNKDQKILSIGRTSILQESGVEVSYDELKRDGFVIKRLDNTVILCGGGDYGTLYAVYEFLNRQIEWEPYAVNEIYFVKTRSIKLLDYDFSDKPAIEHRHGGWFAAQTDPYFAAKWRCYAGEGGMLFNEKVWYYFPHAIFRMVPPATYAEDHPDWYTADKLQPCFTNEEFKKQLVTNLKQLIIDNPSIVFFPFGLEDYPNTMCHCENCQREIDAYKASGLVVRWTNDVVKEIMAWKEEMGITRDLYFPFLAYYDILLPPVNEAGQPIDETCILNKYSPLIYADISAANDHPYTDKLYNGSTLSVLESWVNCCDRIMSYYYTNSFTKRFDWADTIYAHTENYALSAKYNAVYILDDASNSGYQGCAFQQMLGYVYAKLKWNPDVDTNELIDNYITHYYKEAAEDVRAYYYLMKIQVTQTLDTINENGGQWGFLVSHEGECYNKGVLEQALSYLRAGVQKIKDAPHYTDAEKEVYIQRVEAEMFTPLMYILDYFDADYTTKGYLEVLNEMETLVNKYGITGIRSRNNETVPNEEIFEGWRKKKNVA